MFEISRVSSGKDQEHSVDMPDSDLDKNNFFGLNPDCFLINGAKRGAIYNLNSGDIYSINLETKQLLENLQKGSAIKSALDKTEESYLAGFEFLSRLYNLDLGHFSQEKPLVNSLPERPENRLNFVWLELTEGCNLKCLHCYSDSDSKKATYEKLFPELFISHKDWLRVIKEAYELGTRRLQFIGGEPFIYGDKLFDLADFAGNIGYESQEIYTNGTLLNDDRIQNIRKRNMKLAFSFYGPTRSIHEEITQNHGSWESTLRNIKKARSNDIPTRIAIIAMKQNQDYLDETIEFLKNETGVEDVGYDLVRPSGRGCNSELVADKLVEKHLMTAPLFPKIDYDTFQKYLYGHSCWSGELCISSSGNATPCIMERDFIIGNVKEMSLKDILNSNNLVKIWGLSKDYVEVCKDCEYRYGCFDCRPKAKGQSGEFYAKPADCMYDPYTGEWPNGNNSQIESCKPYNPTACLPEYTCIPHDWCRPDDKDPDHCKPDCKTPNCYPHEPSRPKPSCKPG